MIYITQGSEDSVGIEIFLKSFFLLEKKKNLVLIVKKKILENNLNVLKLDYTILKNIISFGHENLNCIFAPEDYTPLDILNLALRKINDNSQHILITLPASKGSLSSKSNAHLGHTDYLRKYYSDKNITMNFVAENENILLISDHIPVNLVSKNITSSNITEQIMTTLKGHLAYLRPIDEILISGLNPHAGENGLIGSEESEIILAITYLNKQLGKIISRGPIPADSIHNHFDRNKNQLFVYMYHDQALTSFKSRNGFLGLNITFGLPFLRISVDHGTASCISLSNKANIMGMYYLLEKTNKLIKEKNLYEK